MILLVISFLTLITELVELKAGKAKDSALGQLLGYVGYLSGSEANVRGILVASGFDSRVIFAARGLPTGLVFVVYGLLSLRRRWIW